MKLVMYVGNIVKVNCGSKFVFLVPGRIYEVCSIRIERRTETTYYILKGIKGEFESRFFEDMSSKPTYFAVSSMVPEVGKIYYCHNWKILDSEGKTELCHTRTSIVKQVDLISGNTYRLVTQNSIYIVTIM